MQVVVEALRVARKLAVFGYPCGNAAFDLDQKLHRDYQSLNIPPPVWLEEHMLYPFPNEDLLMDLPHGWNSEIIPNESLKFHYWMMKTEMSQAWNLSFRLMLRMMPGFAESLLQLVNREPSYRKIFVVTRQPGESRA
jgi:hypothetical protein